MGEEPMLPLNRLLDAGPVGLRRFERVIALWVVYRITRSCIALGPAKLYKKIVGALFGMVTAVPGAECGIIRRCPRTMRVTRVLQCFKQVSRLL